jgi:hypothetical protein
LGRGGRNEIDHSEPLMMMLALAQCFGGARTPYKESEQDVSQVSGGP